MSKNTLTHRLITAHQEAERIQNGGPLEVTHRLSGLVTDFFQTSDNYTVYFYRHTHNYRCLCPYLLISNECCPHVQAVKRYQQK